MQMPLNSLSFSTQPGCGRRLTAAAEASDKRMNWPFSKKKSFFSLSFF